MEVLEQEEWDEETVLMDQPEKASQKLHEEKIMTETLDLVMKDEDLP